MIWIFIIASIFAAAGVACKFALRGIESVPAEVETEKEEEQIEETVAYAIPALIELNEKEAAKKAKHDAELEQAEIDVDFLRGQIASYEGMYRNTKLAYDKAVAKCVHDENTLKASNSAVSEKACKAHEVERDRLHKQLLKTETTIERSLLR